ncbi:hypothetical protein [Emergencia sp.]|uniref:hypothetical protein n=1 Tax=Emergencia sp. TaxID=1926557 RepID=UPI003AEF4C48
MRKDKYGIGVILILLILFNVIAFAVPHRQSSAFWPAYVFTVAAIMMQFLYFSMAFKYAHHKEKVFWGLSRIHVSITYLILQFISGLFFMYAGFVQSWVAVAVGTLLLGGYLLIFISSHFAQKNAERVENNIEEDTSFIRTLTIYLETLYDMTSDDMLKEELKKLYNVCKYSDPVSSEKLVTLEEEISVTYKALYDYVQAKDFSNAQNACETLYHRILERNHACRLLK